MREIMSFALAIAAMAAFAIMDGPKTLGAHPWWADQVVVSGVIGGCILSLVLRFIGVAMNRRLVLGLFLSAIAFGIARYGGYGFAVSYAEDQLAGKLWYFGWHGTMIAVFVMLAAGIGKLIGLRR